MNKSKVLLKCTNCGQEVWKYQSQIKNSKMIFCSQKCQHDWRTGKTEEWRRKGENKKCPICGKMFYCHPSEIETKKTCSIKCKYSYESELELHSGENCNFWAGGFDHYRGANWISQRNKARLRDKNICVICGKTEIEEGKKLTVHHIVPFRFFNFDYKKANDLKNLITICSECHGKCESHGWKQVPSEYQYLLEGIIPQKKILICRKYSTWEIDFIKENHKILTPQEIALKLDRPVSSIKDKAYSLGLKFGRRKKIDNTEPSRKGNLAKGVTTRTET